MKNKRQFNAFIGRHSLVFAVCISVLLLTACDKSKQKASVKVPLPGVEVTEVIQKTIPISMDFSATVKAVKSINIIPRVSGYIVERFFTEGDFVKAGTALYLIDPKPYQASLDAAQAQLAKDQASVKLWKAESARYMRLSKEGAASKEKRDRAVAHLEEFKAAVKQDEADVNSAELQLGYTHITAPFDGRIQKTHVNVGQLVQEHKDKLTSLVQMDPIHVVFNISRSQAFEVHKLLHEGLGVHKPEMSGSQTLGHYQATIQLPDGSPYSEQGVTDYISAQVNPDTDTYEARALFPNHTTEGRDADLIPGQYAPLTVIVGRQPDALLIPQAALVQSQAGMYVYVLGKDNKVEHRKVELGNAYQHYWIIRKGLSKGEKVIVKGVQKVKQGITVEVRRGKS